MKKIITCLAFLISSVSILAQNVSISGKATGAEGKTLVVYAWSDQVTYTQEKIASGKIDKTGNFSFSFKTDKTFFAYLKIDFNQSPIYIEPDKTYRLSISCPSCNAPDDKLNPYFASKDFSVAITNEDSTGLNSLINRFNIDYDEFIRNNYITQLHYRDKAKLDTFRMKIQKKYGTVKNEYFNDLVKYSIAGVEQFAQLKGSATLAKAYLLNKPVLYNNTGYMDFFNDYFKEYLTSESKYITSDILDQTINTWKSFPVFLDSLGKDSILRNEVLRELVALKGLGEIYYSKEYDQANILKMLSYEKVNSKFPVHRTIAGNFITLLTKLTPGTIAPAFKLKDYNGQNYSLSEFNKGKYVYLIFWTTWSAASLSEMDMIGKLKSKYGTMVEFVGISVDKEFLKYYYFMQGNNKYDFTTLHWGNNPDLLENYNVKAYPTFVLIDPQGKIVQCPAEPPSGNLNELLFDLSKRDDKK